MYSNCTLFYMGKLRMSFSIKLKICYCFLNNMILHIMSLIMSQYNVHIYTSESKFSKFPFIHCIKLIRAFLLLNTATKYKILAICLKYFTFYKLTFQSILIIFRQLLNINKACFSDVTYVSNYLSMIKKETCCSYDNFCVKII